LVNNSPTKTNRTIFSINRILTSRNSISKTTSLTNSSNKVKGILIVRTAREKTAKMTMTVVEKTVPVKETAARTAKEGTVRMTTTAKERTVQVKTVAAKEGIVQVKMTTEDVKAKTVQVKMVVARTSVSGTKNKYRKLAVTFAAFLTPAAATGLRGSRTANASSLLAPTSNRPVVRLTLALLILAILVSPTTTITFGTKSANARDELSLI